MTIEISSQVCVGDRVQHTLCPSQLGDVVAVHLHRQNRFDVAEVYSFEYNVQWDEWEPGHLATALYYGVTIVKGKKAIAPASSLN